MQHITPWTFKKKLWVIKQTIILILANVYEEYIFKQKAKTFEFVHNRLYAGLDRRIPVRETGVGEFLKQPLPWLLPRVWNRPDHGLGGL